MIAAAASRQDRTLDTVRLVLLLESKSQAYPNSLKTYFRTVVGQALDLLAKPAENALLALPEAVTLARHASMHQDLHKLIEEVNVKDAITKEQAQMALETLEDQFDANCEPVHLKREIYASI